MIWWMNLKISFSKGSGQSLIWVPGKILNLLILLEIILKELKNSFYWINSSLLLNIQKIGVLMVLINSYGFSKDIQIPVLFLISDSNKDIVMLIIHFGIFLALERTIFWILFTKKLKKESKTTESIFFESNHSIFLFFFQ